MTSPTQTVEETVNGISTALPVEIAEKSVSIGPFPAWGFRESCSVDEALPVARSVGGQTHFLMSRQVHVASSQALTHSIVRLDTMEAVQQNSLWRLQFEPRTQRVMLHKLRIHKLDHTVVDYAALSNLHLSQREEELRSFTLHGRFTLMVVLNDLVPGDIIEAAWTIERHPRIFSGTCASYFTLPQGAFVWHYRFAVIFPDGRPMDWRASMSEYAPVVTELVASGERLWTWTGNNLAVPEQEIHAPSWVLPAFWVQVSDLPEWAGIAQVINEAWFSPVGMSVVCTENVDSSGDGAFERLLAECLAAGADLEAHVEHAIRFVQDHCQFLDSATGLSGYIPASPEVVVRRRFGDCKGLSLLLVSLLRRLGLEARPVLVSTKLGRMLPEFLPSPNWLDHAVVEFTLNGVTRWVDPSIPVQGGGPLGRSVPFFGCGLPVSADSPGLVSPPESHESMDNSYELSEVFLLDTGVRPSFVEVITRATGSHADRLRNRLNQEGPDGFAQRRLEAAVARYSGASRLEPQSLHDARERNEFFIAETFATPGLVSFVAGIRVCRFCLPPPLFSRLFHMPAPDRKQALRLPYPLSIKHTQEFRSFVAPPLGCNVFAQTADGLQFHVERRGSRGGWWICHTVSTRADSVCAEDLPMHARLLADVLRATSWVFTLPCGSPRPYRPPEFGRLPLLNPPPRKQVLVEKPSVSFLGVCAQSSVSVERSRRIRKSILLPGAFGRLQIPRKWWALIFLCLLGGSMLLGVVLVRFMIRL